MTDEERRAWKEQLLFNAFIKQQYANRSDVHVHTCKYGAIALPLGDDE